MPDSQLQEWHSVPLWGEQIVRAVSFVLLLHYNATWILLEFIKFWKVLILMDSYNMVEISIPELTVMYNTLWHQGLNNNPSTMRSHLEQWMHSWRPHVIQDKFWNTYMILAEFFGIYIISNSAHKVTFYEHFLYCTIYNLHELWPHCIHIVDTICGNCTWLFPPTEVLVPDCHA